MDLIDHLLELVFKERPGLFINRNRVKIRLNPDMTVNVSYTFYRGKNVSLDYSCSSLNMEGFLKKFEIDEFEGLHEISKKSLEKMYQLGKGSIFCYCENYFLEFETSDEGLMATDYKGEVHLIKKKLVGNLEFVAYTRKFYEESG